MIATGRFVTPLALGLVLAAAGTGLWLRHAGGWGITRGGPVLSYDAAQYAVAARELAEHGRLATLYALPLELSKHPRPPWPLALVQPGLVIAEAGLLRVVPASSARETREAIVLLVPFACYLTLGIAIAWIALALLRRHAPTLPPAWQVAAAAVPALAFLLEAEAQHFAAGGFTELPFSLGLVAALSAIALGSASRHPLAFGLLLGVTGAFRGNMLWLAPILGLAAAAAAPPELRVRVLVRSMLGYALPLLPWWIYKWQAFGSPAWDLSRLALWDGVEGHTWFTLNHLPELPALPSGWPAVLLLARKLVRNLGAVLLVLFDGPRALWVGGIAVWLLAGRRDRALALAAIATLAVLAVTVGVAALTVPQSRYLFPARVVAEAAGMLCVWSLLVGYGEGGQERTRRLACVGLAVLALSWGAWRTVRGVGEAQAMSAERGVPSPAEMAGLVDQLDRTLARGEPVMSNLGPILSWYARRPVVHLALTPDDVASCREKLEMRHVLLVFRDTSRAWPAWMEVVQRPEEAPHHPEWNVVSARREITPEGFLVVWLELGPLAPRLAQR